MVSADVGLALDDVEARAPDPLFAQRAGERVRVDERAAGCVDEDSVLLHPAQKLCVDDVARSVSAGREHEEDVARARELVCVDAADGAQAVLRGEGGFEGGVAGRGRVGGVDAVSEAEGGDAREGRLGDAPEAEEACRARWRERAGAQLGPGEEERGKVEVGPLGQQRYYSEVGLWSWIGLTFPSLTRVTPAPALRPAISASITDVSATFGGWIYFQPWLIMWGIVFSPASVRTSGV